MKIALAVPETFSFPLALDVFQRCGFSSFEITDDRAKDFIGKDDRDIAGMVCGPDLAALAECIDRATKLSCRFLIFPSGSLFNRSGIASPATVDRLLGLADVAADAGVMLLMENEPSHGSALRLWRLLDRLNHPSVACCWNTMLAGNAGDTPAVAVPMLGSRIAYVRLWDGKNGGRQATPCRLGEGDAPLRQTINRLRGIGFNGTVSVCLPDGITTDTPELESVLIPLRDLLTNLKITKVKQPADV